MIWIEIVGLITVLVVTLKSLYNVGHFVYTTFLGALLGHNIDLRKCGPWAGNLNILYPFIFCLKRLHYFESRCSCDRRHGRHWKIIRPSGNAN